MAPIMNYIKKGEFVWSKAAARVFREIKENDKGIDFEITQFFEGF